jgi:4-hydroxyphenylpyruvate dioxygenase-like putative hemolysin
MKMVGVQHIGIAVKDMESSIANFENIFGIKCTKREKISASKVERRGNGIHHICFDVEGIDKWLETLKSKDVKLLNETPREGATGHRVAFINPESADGILFELSE